MPSVVTVNGTSATFELPDGSTAEVPVFEETNTTGTHRSVFLTLPREAIFNDDDCQPRVVRSDHAGPSMPTCSGTSCTSRQAADSNRSTLANRSASSSLTVNTRPWRAG